MQMQNSKSTEEDISLLFQTAILKLDKIEAQSKRQKTEIIQDLARDLQGKIPTDTIATEIIQQLHGRVSERLVHYCLDEKYKKQHRIENARRQNEKKQRGVENLAKELGTVLSSLGNWVRRWNFKIKISAVSKQEGR